MYTTLASARTPSLVLFLIDVSGSLGKELSPNLIRIDAVSHLIQRIAIRMVQRSTKGAMISPRYHVAMFAYSSQVIDLLGGIKPIDELAKLGVPQLTTLDKTDTARAFSWIKKLLTTELPKYAECPAPIVLHITDGGFNGNDPIPIVEDIRNMSTPDGNVLIANVYVNSSPKEATFLIDNNAHWVDAYDEKLFNMSSTFPDAYRAVYAEFGFQIPAGAKMYIRGYIPEAFELLCPMTSATPITSNY